MNTNSTHTDETLKSEVNNPIQNNHINTLKMTIFALITILLWGSAFVFSKLIQGQFDPISLSFLRCAISAIFLLLLGKIYHIKKLKHRHLVLFASGGLTGFSLYMIAFNSGLLTITAATSSVIIATVPIATAMAATIIYKEHIHFAGWIAILSAFSGVVILLLWDDVLSVNIGILYTFFSVAMFCTYNLINRKLILLGYTSLEITTYCMSFGALFLAITAPQAIVEVIDASVFERCVLVYLSVFCSAGAYLCWGRAMYYAKKTSDVTNFMFLTPFVSMVLGLLILKESPNFGTIFGGIIIVSSMYAFQKINQKTTLNSNKTKQE